MRTDAMPSVMRMAHRFLAVSAERASSYCIVTGKFELSFRPTGGREAVQLEEDSTLRVRAVLPKQCSTCLKHFVSPASLSLSSEGASPL